MKSIILLKKILVFILLSSSTIVYAIDYYISNEGVDVSDGLSSSTSWKTITKLNSAFAQFNSGDRILFRRGDTFFGTIVVTKSGSARDPIVIGAYGTGSDPVITGFTTLNTWKNEGGGVYSKVVSLESYPNMVTVDGDNTPMGRYPDTGWLSTDSHTGTSSISDAALSASPDWSGAELVIHSNAWVIDRDVISNHTGNTINYIAASTYEPQNGTGYFIQKHLSTLTSLKEWYYNTYSAKFYMYFGVNDPESYVVKAATLNELIRIWYPYNYITIENIAFEGANAKAFNIKSSGNITIQNCKINYSGNYAVYGGANGGTDSDNFTFSNNTINNTNDIAITLANEFSNSVITGNTITNTATIAGMGGSADGHYFGIYLYRTPNTIISYNSIINCGYVPIVIGSSEVIVNNNFIDTYCTVKTDGGGIYTTGTSTKTISGNIILNGYVGIYLDDKTVNSTVHGNTTANCLYGIYLHNAHENKVDYNTSFNNGDQLLLVHDNISPNDPLRNNIIENNIYISKTSSQRCLTFRTVHDDLPLFGTEDNNYFARPIDDNITIRTTQLSTGTKNITLSEWQLLSNQDAHSFKSPVQITKTDDIRIEYNASKANKVIILDTPMIDIRGVKYQNNITLLPYNSAVLIVDPDPTHSLIPVYSGSYISNAAPTVLQMIYNINLDSTIVPAATAFTVLVNGLNRVVNSVAVSGNRIWLTLTGSIIRNDIITLSYTRPAFNPLQSTSTGIAAEIYNQSVRNNVIGGNGINDISLPVIRIFPNPANEIINISFDGPVLKQKKIQISDFTGKIVLDIKSDLINADQEYTINTSRLDNGLYIIKAGTEDKMVLGKFIIMH